MYCNNVEGWDILLYHNNNTSVYVFFNCNICTLALFKIDISAHVWYMYDIYLIIRNTCTCS